MSRPSSPVYLKVRRKQIRIALGEDEGATGANSISWQKWQTDWRQAGLADDIPEPPIALTELVLVRSPQ